MTVSGLSIHAECDNCGAAEDLDLRTSQSPDDALDVHGWQWRGAGLALVCADCVDADDDDYALRPVRLTLRALLKRYGVDVAALLDTPLEPLSLSERRGRELPVAHVEAHESVGALSVRIEVPLFDGQARPTPAVALRMDSTGAASGPRAADLPRTSAEALGRAQQWAEGGLSRGREVVSARDGIAHGRTMIVIACVSSRYVIGLCVVVGVLVIVGATS